MELVPEVHVASTRVCFFVVRAHGDDLVFVSVTTLGIR